MFNYLLELIIFSLQFAYKLYFQFILRIIILIVEDDILADKCLIRLHIQ